MAITFEIPDREAAAFIEWDKAHTEVCPMRYHGSIGGRITYVFAPTSLGLVMKVNCACGEEIDLTHYEEW